jgi:DNA-binding NarL/FixJ family response regulator
MADEIRVLLVDDHAVLRSGLKALLSLEPDLDVVAEASTGEEAIQRIQHLHPDVVVMDLDMPGMGGLEATRQIAATESGTRVLVLTSQAEEDNLLPVLEAGGHGFVHKSGPEEDLVQAIRTVARGEVFLYPRSAKLLLLGYKNVGEAAQPGPLDDLSDREREVAVLAAEGYTSAEIGKKLFLSPKTVDTYRSRLMQKLGMTHRSELVRFALSTGLLKPPE